MTTVAAHATEPVPVRRAARSCLPAPLAAVTLVTATAAACVALLVPPEHAWTVLAIAAATFVSEDLTCIGTGLLIHQGAVPPVAGLVGCTAGIALGDLALWAVGRSLWHVVGRWPWVRARVSEPALRRAADWMDRNLVAAVFAARVVPGTRLPTYLAAGVLGRQPWRFVGWAMLAAVLWTPLLVLLAAAAGPPFAALFTGWVAWGWVPTVVAAVALLAALHVIRGGLLPAARARLAARLDRWRRYEFWPAWLFYLPVIPRIAWLALRHRGLTVITAANPDLPHGGVVGESKADILRRLPSEWVAPFVLLSPGALDDRLGTLNAALDGGRLGWPLILKPDQGQRGAGVRLAREPGDARAYLDANRGPVIAQAFHPGPHEAGLFYIRLPGAQRGRIFSITDKHFPVVVGDGVATLEELIWRHPRYRLQAGTFRARWHDRLADVPAAGQALPLALAGNHCQGTRFTDGGALWTPALEARVDAIARQCPGFHFGRFDVRYRDVHAFRAGRDLAILELNGITSESTNLYDPAWPLSRAYRTLQAQWDVLFRVGAASRAGGTPPSPLWQVLADARAFYRGNQASALAD